jgi:protein TonB
MSRRLGHTGKVIVGFTMLKDGTIINVHVHEGCPFDRLNEAAIEAVQRAGKFKPIPDELQISQMDMNVPVVFKQI